MFLTKRNSHESKHARAKAIGAAADEASEILSNTRTVARSSYIHASIIKAYEQGKLRDSLLRGRIRNGLTRIESALMRFLERNPLMDGKPHRNGSGYPSRCSLDP